jgi:thiosulfate/3-mercaptopyruvate sulfurtransferase
MLFCYNLKEGKIMTYDLLVSTEDLANHLDDPYWLVVDCRFVLSRPDEKEEQYLRAHIPGAIYANLDRDLSGDIVPGVTGRHPLPAPEEAAERFGEMGIGPGMQIVAYDDQGGSLAAVRLWLMLRWLGYKTAAVLDGGWQKWLEEDRPVNAGKEVRSPRLLKARINESYFVNAEEVDRMRIDPSYKLIDVRAPERYSGEIEPIDPVAGHIPGAENVPYSKNLNDKGVFRSPAELRKQYQDLLGNIPSENTIFYCGSGVTSIHSLLAMLVAGLGQAKIYPGSWSEWITDRTRPVATGHDKY